MTAHISERAGSFRFCLFSFLLPYNLISVFFFPMKLRQRVSLPEIYFKESTLIIKVSITHGDGNPTLLCVHIVVSVGNHVLVHQSINMAVRGLITSLF